MGFDTADDAAVYKLNDTQALIQTVDIFPPAVDDPYEYGQIAAANSLSDVWAMGGVATLCMNILMFPANLPAEDVHAILSGGYDKAKEAGVAIVGGHTVKDDIPKYGLSVSGIVHPDKILRNNSIQEGDKLILTKPIGTGVLTNADRGGLLTNSQHKLLINVMTTLNKYAADAVLGMKCIHACTDVTGFSLLGHSYEMSQDTELSIVIDHKHVPYIPHAKKYAAMGLVPAATYSNKKYLHDKINFAKTLDTSTVDLLYDPQTSGGLLYSVAKDEANKVLDILSKVCNYAEIIGHVEKRSSKSVTVI